MKKDEFTNFERFCNWFGGIGLALILLYALICVDLQLIRC